MLTLLCGFDVVALVCGAVVVWRQRWLGVGGEVVAAIIGGGALGITALLLLAPAGGFAAMRAATHALFCVLLPLLALRAIRVRRHSRWLAAAGLAIAVLGEACYVWAREVEPFRLEVTRATVTSERLRGLEQPLLVALVADLQTDVIGAHEIGVFDQLVAAKPDLVLWLGDYLQLSRAERAQLAPALREQLARLQPRLGMFAVEGDVDHEVQDVRELFAGTGVRVLSDASETLPGVPIELIGLSRIRSRAPLDIGTVRRLRGERFPILFGHAPDFMQAVLRGGLQADALMVAGHTHGGQVQVPGFGPLVTFSSVPRWLAGGGVFQRGDSWLVVSRGIGMERGEAPRVRFWCRPQLVLLELRER